MNESSTNITMGGRVREPLSEALSKNVTILLLWIFINCINISLILTFFKNQIFYMNPRYILFIHLVINDMSQVTLAVILFLLTYTVYRIKVYICYILILLLVVNTNNTPLNLACMAIECYIAVCFPLRHIQICTVRRTLQAIGLIWCVNVLFLFTDLFFMLATRPLDYFYSDIVCMRIILFADPVLMKKRDISFTVCLFVVWLIIFYTYFKIVFTAKKASGEAKKARNTILLHGFQLLLCVATYISPQIFEVIIKAFPEMYMSFIFANYVIVHILPRCISPFIYGVRDQTMRRYLKRYLMWKVDAK